MYTWVIFYFSCGCILEASCSTELDQLVHYLTSRHYIIFQKRNSFLGNLNRLYRILKNWPLQLKMTVRKKKKAFECAVVCWIRTSFRNKHLKQMPPGGVHYSGRYRGSSHVLLSRQPLRSCQYLHPLSLSLFNFTPKSLILFLWCMLPACLFLSSCTERDTSTCWLTYGPDTH